MKVLLITDYIPYPPRSGGAWRVYGLVSKLCKRQEVALCAPTWAPSDLQGASYLREIGMAVDTFDRPGQSGISKALGVRLKALFSPIPVRWVVTWEDAWRRAISEAIRKHDPDVIWVEHLTMFRFYDSFAVGKPIVLGQQNVESILEAEAARSLGFSFNGLLLRRESKKVPAFEREMMSKADLVLAVSDVDRDILQSMSPDAKIVTIPNGADVDMFKPAKPSDSRTVILTGTLDYPPNIEAAHIMAREVFPRIRAAVPDVKVKIVGRQPVQSVRDLACDGLEVIPDVPDIRQYIEEAAVIAVPLRSGSGTRIKILEAMAMGKAIVSTHKGAEGLNVTDNHEIMLRDDIDSFAKAIVELLESSEKRISMGQNARHTVESEYSYDALAEKLEKELIGLLESKMVGSTAC